MVLMWGPVGWQFLIREVPLQGSTVGPCLRSYGGPEGGAISYK